MIPSFFSFISDVEDTRIIHWTVTSLLTSVRVCHEPRIYRERTPEDMNSPAARYGGSKNK